MNTENVDTNVVEDTNVEQNEPTQEPTAVVHTNVAAALASAVKVKGKPGRKIIEGSGLQKARAIYTRMTGAVRKDIVVAFVSAGIPKPSANTYYHLIKNSSK